MECPRFVPEKIGELYPPEFREHLSGCAGCARDVEELREVRNLYRRASTEKYPGGVPRVPRFRAAGIPMAAAAAILVVVFAGILAGPWGKARSPAEPGTKPGTYVRIRLEPWGSDRKISQDFEECWQKLEHLENRP